MLDPPLPPITIDQIQHGELSALLEEDDYNLASMVNIKLYILIILIITSLLNNIYPYFMLSLQYFFSTQLDTLNLETVYSAPISPCGLLGTAFLILHKALNYLLVHTIKIKSLKFHISFQWSSSH